MAYTPEEHKSKIGMEHLASAFYRHKAEEGGYLKEVRVVRAVADRKVWIGGTSVATGKVLTREVEGDFTAIDQDIIGAINSMVSEAKSLSAGIMATPNCCDAHAQGAAAVEGRSNASDPTEPNPESLVRAGILEVRLCAPPQESQHEKCGRGEHEATERKWPLPEPMQEGTHWFCLCRHCRSLYVPR